MTGFVNKMSPLKGLIINRLKGVIVLEMVLPSASPENVMLKEKVNPPCGLLFCLSQPF